MSSKWLLLVCLNLKQKLMQLYHHQKLKKLTRICNLSRKHRNLCLYLSINQKIHLYSRTLYNKKNKRVKRYWNQLKSLAFKKIIKQIYMLIIRCRAQLNKDKFQTLNKRFVLIKESFSAYRLFKLTSWFLIQTIIQTKLNHFSMRLQRLTKRSRCLM